MSKAGRSDAQRAHSGGPRRFAKSLFNTIPIVVAGSMAVGLNLTGPVSEHDSRRPERDKASPSELGKTIREALAAAHAASTAEATSAGTMTIAAAPASYTVAAGDTISGIAGRFGLPTASVLAANGLGWKSVIFPGQVLTLTSGAVAPIAAPTPPAAAVVPAATQYTIVAGDSIGRIATRFGVSTASLLAANGLVPTSIIYAGRTIAIPGQSGPAQETASTPAPVAQAAPERTAAISHTIGTGDTVASIASRYGVSVQTILDANGLGWSSIIYSGRTLTIPAVVVAPAPAAPDAVAPLTEEMARNAQTIIGVGRSLGVSDYGLVIALSAAMQESSLKNLDHGDRDSLGLFQQRPSTGWGAPEQVMDPSYSARLFFGGRSNPNRGVTRGLLEIPGWQSMAVTQAAQAVQLSAYPDAYAKWEVSAWAWLDQLT